MSSISTLKRSSRSNTSPETKKAILGGSSRMAFRLSWQRNLVQIGLASFEEGRTGFFGSGCGGRRFKG